MLSTVTYVLCSVLLTTVLVINAMALSISLASALHELVSHVTRDDWQLVSELFVDSPLSS